MYYMTCDYHEGALPAVLQAIVDTNMEQHTGYMTDSHCENAAKTILERVQKPSAEVHFVSGGTLANMIVISSALRPYQGAMSASSGHINVHETGAIEMTGHKVLTIPSDVQGKITAKQVQDMLEDHFRFGENEHMVMPGLLYLSNTTERGGIYTKSELQAFREVCDQYGIPLYMDGARLGYALTAPGNDLDLPALAELCDAFTIGGTKLGLLFGEAIVLTRPEKFPHFRYNIKQKGGMFAKGRLIGVQFEAVLQDDLYFKEAEKANRQALRIKNELVNARVKTKENSPSNQQFVSLPKDLYEELEKEFVFEVETVGEETVDVRICTSWATSEEKVERLVWMIQNWAARNTVACGF